MNQELKENIVVPSGRVSSWRARQRCGMLDDVFVAVSIEQRRGGVRRICAGWTDMDWTISLLTLTLTLTPALLSRGYILDFAR